MKNDQINISLELDLTKIFMRSCGLGFGSLLAGLSAGHLFYADAMSSSSVLLATLGLIVGAGVSIICYKQLFWNCPEPLQPLPDTGILQHRSL